MDFNDFVVLGEKDYKVLKQNYAKTMQDDISDLKEIYNKMLSQKESLQNANTDGRYDQAIARLEKNLADLSSIIANTANVDVAYHSPHPNLPNIPLFTKPFKQSTIQAPDNGAISPIRSIEEINNSMPQKNNGVNYPNQDNSRNFPQQDNMNFPNQNASDKGNSMLPDQNNTTSPGQGNSPQRNNDNTTTPESPARSNDNVSNTNSRRIVNSPMQGSFISNFAKQFNVSNLLRPGHKSQKENLSSPLQNQSMNAPRRPNTRLRNRHMPVPPHNPLLTNQMDILRLLLLYMTMRPHCRFCSRIATISSEQFDVLNSLI